MSWLFLLLICLVLSFALSGLESAVVAVSRVRVRHAAREGDRRAARLLPLIEDRDALLGAITVTNHLMNLSAFLIIAWKLIGVSGAWGYLTAFLVALPIFLIGLEVLPKKLFRRYPFRVIRALSPLVITIGWFRPLFRLMARGPSLDLISVPDQSSGRNDLRKQAQMLQDQHQLSAGATRLIHQVLDYRQLRARDVMRPLAKSIALSSDLPLNAALIMAREYGFSSLPVIGEKGGFVGLIDLGELTKNQPQDRLVRQHMRTLDSLHEQDSALQSLQRMRKRGRSLCLVLDDKELPSGILHEEDLLRQLLGTRA